MALYQLLGIPHGITAVIGGGGKTSLLRHLARELPGTVLLCTSTHFFPYPDLPLLRDPSPEALREALRVHRVVCAGSIEPSTGKLTALSCPLHGIADFVLCEADGSRGLPLKAHAAHEPIIPEGTQLTVQVVGLSGIGAPVSEAVHREVLWRRLSGHEGARVTAEAAAAVLNAEDLTDVYYLNQMEDRECEALQLSHLLRRPCVAGSLREEQFLCLY